MTDADATVQKIKNDSIVFCCFFMFFMLLNINNIGVIFVCICFYIFNDSLLSISFTPFIKNMLLFYIIFFFILMLNNNNSLIRLIDIDDSDDFIIGHIYWFSV